MSIGARIAAIVPVYNSARFIAAALDSVAAQSRRAAAVVVVDDASTDETAAVVHARADGVQLLVNEDNRGPGFSRNRGVAASDSDYLAFLDADDCWLPDHLERLAGALDAHPEAGFVFSRKRNTGPDRGVWPDASRLLDGPGDYLPLFMRDNLLVASTMVVRRTAFERTGGFDERTYRHQGRRVQIEDFHLALTLARQGPVLGLPDVTVSYRLHPGQSTELAAWQNLQAAVHRLDALKTEAAKGADRPRLALLGDRVVRSVEDTMERLWEARQIPELRAFVRLCGRHPLLQPLALRYGPRAVLPAPLSAYLRRSRS